MSLPLPAATAVAALSLAVVPAGRVSAWQTIVGSASGQGGGANSVAVGPDGSIAAAGVLRRNGNTWSFGVVKLDGRDGTPRWKELVAGSEPVSEGGTGVAFDSTGDVVAAGVVDDAAEDQNGAVVKLRGSTGSEVWRYELDGTGTSASGGDGDFATAVAVDGADDVVVAGIVDNAGTGAALAVVELAGASGTELWRHEIDDAAPSQLFFGASHSLTLDGAGNVYVAGVTPLSGPRDWLVVKLSGTTGAEQWRTTIDGTLGGYDDPRAVAVGPTGEVAVAGGLTETSSASMSFGVVLLAGDDGTELWRHSIDGTVAGSTAHGVVFDSQGDVVASGLTQNVGSLHDFTVLKLAGASGAERWRVDLAGSLSSGVDYSTDLRIDADDHVLAAGRFQDSASSYDLAVVKLDGANGSELWREQARGRLSELGSGEAYALALDERGGAVAAGTLTRTDVGSSDFAVVKLSEKVAGARIQLVDRADDSTKRTLSVSSKDAGLYTVAPGSNGDPTLGGATLEIVNPTTLETAALSLPSVRWELTRELTGRVTYGYRDPLLLSGACDRVTWKEGRGFRARCQGAGIGFSLDEPAQGSLGVRLRLDGTGAVQTCMLFDASSVRRDRPATGDRSGTFDAKMSAAPAACP